MINAMRHLFTKHEIQFILWFCGIFLGSIFLLALLGLLPTEFQVNGGETFEQKTRNFIRQIIEGSDAQKTDTKTDPVKNNFNDIGKTNINSEHKVGVTEIKATSGDVIYAEEPIRIKIPSIKVDSIIKNPTSNHHEILDAELTKGVVHYPGSGYPGLGNMFLFGHSTGFSVVQNQAYKVFNRLKDLKNGDTITIDGDAATYEYKVINVKKVTKESTLVSFDTSKNMITLSTCDSFGKASDRYVVEGELVSIVKK